jgi:drug/metabolite transporter (DMT)-like permease
MKLHRPGKGEKESPVKNSLDAYVCLSGAMVLVGSAVVVGKVITQAFPLFLASTLRFALAAGVLTPYVLLWGGGFGKLTRRDWWLLACMAFCGQVVFTLFLLWGLRLTSALDAGIITSTTPAAMAIMALLILGERLRMGSALGVALAVAAMVVVNLMTQAQGAAAAEGGQRWLGNLLVAGAVVGEAVFLLVRKRLSSGIPNLTVAAALCILGLAMSLPVGLWEARDFAFSAVSLGGWLSIIYFGLLFTVLAYFLWFRGVSKVSGGTAGVFTAVMPMSALGLSHVFLGESLTWPHLAAGGMVVAAIVLISLSDIGSPAERKPLSLPDSEDAIRLPAGMGRW